MYIYIYIYVGTNIDIEHVAIFTAGPKRISSWLLFKKILFGAAQDQLDR